MHHDRDVRGRRIAVLRGIEIERGVDEAEFLEVHFPGHIAGDGPGVEHPIGSGLRQVDAFDCGGHHRREAEVELEVLPVDEVPAHAHALERLALAIDHATREDRAAREHDVVGRRRRGIDALHARADRGQVAPGDRDDIDLARRNVLHREAAVGGRDTVRLQQDLLRAAQIAQPARDRAEVCLRKRNGFVLAGRILARAREHAARDPSAHAAAHVGVRVLARDDVQAGRVREREADTAGRELPAVAGRHALEDEGAVLIGLGLDQAVVAVLQRGQEIARTGHEHDLRARNGHPVWPEDAAEHAPAAEYVHVERSAGSGSEHARAHGRLGHVVGPARVEEPGARAHALEMEVAAAVGLRDGDGLGAPGHVRRLRVEHQHAAHELARRGRHGQQVDAREGHS